MDTGKAAAIISKNITEFKSQVESEWKLPSECNDFPAWVEVLDDHVNSEIRGLKIICFDNGDMTAYPGYKKRLEKEWTAVKQYLSELFKTKC